MEDPVSLIKKLAKKYHFDLVGISPAQTSKLTQLRLDQFLNDKYDAGMKWIKEKKELRKSPKSLWPESISAIIFGFNYCATSNSLIELDEKKCGLIASYGRRKDYHDVLKGRLKQIAGKLSTEMNSEVKVFVDTAPLMEKPLAVQAGLGWQGKHTNLVSKEFGSWLLLGAILIAKKIDYNNEHKDYCGSCNKCIQICPTGALDIPYRLDARKCISYLTIEHKGSISKKYRKLIGNRIFGCDDCLVICPWNNFAKESKDLKLSEIKYIHLQPLKRWLSFNEEEFRNFTSGTPIKRTGYKRMIRNCLIAAGNSNDKCLIILIKKFLDCEDDVLRGSAIWALQQLMREDDFANLKQIYYSKEKVKSVKNEWFY